MTRTGASVLGAGLLVAGHALVQGCRSGCEAPNDGSRFCEELDARVAGACTDTDLCVTYDCQGGGVDECNLAEPLEFPRAPVDMLRSLHGELCSGGLGSGVVECDGTGSGFDAEVVVWCKPTDACTE